MSVLVQAVHACILVNPLVHIEKRFLLGMVVKHWHKLPRGVVDSLETFKTCVDKFLSNLL